MTRAAVALVALVTACGPAAPPVAPIRPPATEGAVLAGSWVLVAADDLQPDGRRTPAYGSAPSGLLMIDADGRYSLQIFRADRPAFAAGKTQGTPAEYQAAVLGMSSHIGHCRIDPVTRTLDFHIEAASFPNWNGTEQKRKFELANDELSYQVPAAAGTVAVPISVWRRIRRPGR